jgi:hypothetical protein
MKRILRSTMMLLWLSLLSFPALAQNNSIKDLTKGADVILTGKVVSQNSNWNENGTKIYTYVNVQVNEYLKGSIRDENIVVKHPGGEVGDVGELYTHMPSFKNNEEVVLFLSMEKSDKEFKVINGEKGKILLPDNDAAAKEKNVRSIKEEVKKFIE